MKRLLRWAGKPKHTFHDLSEPIYEGYRNRGINRPYGWCYVDNRFRVVRINCRHVGVNGDIGPNMDQYVISFPHGGFVTAEDEAKILCFDLEIAAEQVCTLLAYRCLSSDRLGYIPNIIREIKQILQWPGIDEMYIKKDLRTDTYYISWHPFNNV